MSHIVYDDSALEDDGMTVAEAAAALSVSRSTIYNLINAERLVVAGNVGPLRVTSDSVWAEYDRRYPTRPPRVVEGEEGGKRRWWQRAVGAITSIATKVAISRWGKP